MKTNNSMAFLIRRRHPGSVANFRGVTLTELLVVISIMIIILSILAGALGAFTHTSRVDAAANTLATVLREAKHYAMRNNVPVTPVILRNLDNKFEIVYAAKTLHFRGTMAADETNVYAPATRGAEANPWSLTRTDLDGAQMDRDQYNVFVYMVGTPTLDLNALETPQAYYEMLQMRITRPSAALSKLAMADSSQYKYEVLARGVHNTKPGTYNEVTTGGGGTDGYVVVSTTNSSGPLNAGEARGYSLGGTLLADHILLDSVPGPEALSNSDPVACTQIAQAAVYLDDSSLIGGIDVFLRPEQYPVFLPIFMPDGRVSAGISRNVIGGSDIRRLSEYAPWPNQTIRVLDEITREARYISIDSGNGTVTVSRKLPRSHYAPDDPNSPDYNDPGVPDPRKVNEDLLSSSSTTSSNSTSSSSSTSASTSTSSTSSATSTASSNSTASTGTGSTSSSSSSSSASSTSTGSSSASSTASSTNSSSTTAASSSTTSASSASSSSSNSTASTGTGSTSSSSSSSASSSSNSSSTSSSNSASNSSSASSASSNSSSSTSTGSTSGQTGGGSPGDPGDGKTGYYY